MFRIDGQRYGLSLASVERVLPAVEISPLTRAPAVVLGAVNLQGRTVPVVDIRRRFGLPFQDRGLTGQLLVARTARRTLALPVDEVLGVSPVCLDAVTPPEEIFPGIGYIAGVAALEDGLLFIQDLDAFLTGEEEGDLAAALEDNGP